MPPDRARVLRSIIARAYPASDHPALIHQAAQWGAGSPLHGVRIVDASPVFPNTLAKHVPLLAGGAELTVFLSPALPHDREAADLLQRIGVPVMSDPKQVTPADVVLDCAGSLSTVPSGFGYVELTKSGERIYASSPKPVFSADDSRVKLIETSLGTGDGFIRALAHFGHRDVSGRSVVVFGCGKVGRGAAWRASREGAVVTIIDPDPDARPPGNCTLIAADDEQAVMASLAESWCVVSATGVAGALAPLAKALEGSEAILANLGAEDEFGPDMPAHRVLNGKSPVNFALREPTRLRYLDATFALHNACALALLTGDQPAGISRPPQVIEDEILAVVRGHSGVAGELSASEEDLL